ncbi:hypothetical protein J4G48_0012875 [Bradyrhizobium barranii subsp. apii]|uniref:hypothetical protein n=1 Tax=Bradyrhizobium barranii TaxID=2992140 RepID=UPI001AA1BF6E|nr:hypothetical protein [Bradyrhizobium barranii]UPT98883.1 hypothetical protein J4G48_0012875 [Bradyrhizobium barranii subsp. apii]
MGLSNAERQARWRAKRAAAIEALRQKAPASSTDAAEIVRLNTELAELRNSVLDLKLELGSAANVARRRTGAMTKAEFNLILSCLHPDTRASASETKLAAAFRLANELRYVLCNEQEMPLPPTHHLTVKELKARQGYVEAQRAAEQRAKRKARCAAKRAPQTTSQRPPAPATPVVGQLNGTQNHSR